MARFAAIIVAWLFLGGPVAVAPARDLSLVDSFFYFDCSTALSDFALADCLRRQLGRSELCTGSVDERLACLERRVASRSSKSGH